MTVLAAFLLAGGGAVLLLWRNDARARVERWRPDRAPAPAAYVVVPVLMVVLGVAGLWLSLVHR